MKKSTSSKPADENPTEQLAQLLKQQRGSFEEFQAAQQERLERAEATLAEQVQRRHDEILARLNELDERQSKIESAEEEIEQSRKSVSLDQQQYQAELERLGEQRAEVERNQAELAEEREEAASRRIHTEGQRTRIAREFQAQRAEHLKELDRRQAEIENLSSERLAQLDSRLAEATAAAEKGERQIEELLKEREQVAERLSTAESRFDNATKQLSQAEERLAELDRRLAEAAAAAEAGEAGEQYKRLYEKAQEEIAELRAGDEDRNRQFEELNARQSKIEDTEAEIERNRQQFALDQQQHQMELEQLGRQREAVEQKQTELAEEREELSARRIHTEGQRRRIAREFQAQQAARRKDFARSQAEIENLETERLAQLESQLADARAESEQGPRELADVVKERDRLAERLSAAEERSAEMEQRLAAAPAAASGEGGEDYQRLYEMALDDIRELKDRNEEQKKQLDGACTSEAYTTGAVSAVDLGGSADWETQKQRILAALESDFPADDEETAQERLEIERVVQSTEEAMAAKELVIGQLRQQLDEQSTTQQDAQRQAASGEMLDNDELVQQERDKLLGLQEEVQEKLRKAEIDISIERAKIARERAEIEEKLRSIGDKDPGDEAKADKAAESQKPTRGRWLAHLGIKDLEE